MTDRHRPPDLPSLYKNPVDRLVFDFTEAFRSYNAAWRRDGSAWVDPADVANFMADRVTDVYAANGGGWGRKPYTSNKEIHEAILRKFGGAASLFETYDPPSNIDAVSTSYIQSILATNHHADQTPKIDWEFTLSNPNPYAEADIGKEISKVLRRPVDPSPFEDPEPDCIYYALTSQTREGPVDRLWYRGPDNAGTAVYIPITPPQSTQDPTSE